MSPLPPLPTAAQRLGPRGVSLLELLVSIVILSVGLLGLAGLQTRALAYGQSALFRSQATALTDDILDRMRVDRAHAKAKLWDTALSTPSASITGSALYETDLKDWKEQVETLLPSGKAQIAVVDDTCTVILEWDDSRGREPAQQFLTKTQL